MQLATDTGLAGSNVSQCNTPSVVIDSAGAERLHLSSDFQCAPEPSFSASSSVAMCRY